MKDFEFAEDSDLVEVIIEAEEVWLAATIELIRTEVEYRATFEMRVHKNMTMHDLKRSVT